MTGAKSLHNHGDKHDKTPSAPSGAAGSCRLGWGDPPQAGGRRQPSPGCRAGGLTKPLSEDMSGAICLTDKLLAVFTVGWYHPAKRGKNRA